MSAWPDEISTLLWKGSNGPHAERQASPISALLTIFLQERQTLSQPQSLVKRRHSAELEVDGGSSNIAQSTAITGWEHINFHWFWNSAAPQFQDLSTWAQWHNHNNREPKGQHGAGHGLLHLEDNQMRTKMCTFRGGAWVEQISSLKWR